MSNLVEHAKRELRILGYTGEEPADSPDRWMYDHIIKMVETFSEEGHSGSSASYAIHVVSKLLQFKNVTPLTSDPEEWMEVSGFMNGQATWQSRRRSDAFSHDGGKTYYCLDDLKFSRFKLVRKWRKARAMRKAEEPQP